MQIRPTARAVVNRSIRKEDEKPLGMTLGETLEAFIISRENKTHGANKNCRTETLGIYRKDIGRWITFMVERAHTHYNHVGRSDMRAFVNHVTRDLGWAEATKNKLWRSLRTFFNWVEKDEMCYEDYKMDSWRRELPKIPRVDRKQHVVEPEDVLQFRDAIETHTRAGLRDHLLVSVLIDCGPRAGELTYLRMEHLFLDQGYLIVPQEGKTGTATVPLSPKSVELMRAWLMRRAKFAKLVSGRPNPYVFLTDAGLPLKRGYISRRFVRLRQKLGLGCTPKGNIAAHNLRHFFATEFLKGGGDLADLKTITRHESYDTLDLYVHLSGTDAVKQRHTVHSPLMNLERKVAEAKRKNRK